MCLVSILKCIETDENIYIETDENKDIKINFVTQFELNFYFFKNKKDKITCMSFLS